MKAIVTGAAGGVGRAAAHALAQAAKSRSRVQREGMIPLRRIGRPEEVARVIAFLARPDATNGTGVDTPVDGGLGTTPMHPAQSANRDLPAAGP